MKKTIKSFTSFLKSLKSNSSFNLTVNENNRIKNSLIKEIYKNPVRKSLFFSFIDVFKNTFIPLTQNRMRILSFVAVFLVLFSGVSYAAEGALPGDVLYSVKVDVNEELRSLFNFSPEAELAWEKEKIERRVSELEALEEEGEVSDEAKAELAMNLSEHVEDINKIFDELDRDADGDFDEMEDDYLNFLDEHSSVLDELLVHGEGLNEDDLESEVDLEDSDDESEYSEEDVLQLEEEHEDSVDNNESSFEKDESNELKGSDSDNDSSEFDDASDSDDEIEGVEDDGDDASDSDDEIEGVEDDGDDD
jgi:hypothetical protein